MTELKTIALAAEGLRQRAEPFLVATVVRVSGSSYRRPGARMLITRDQWVAGSVSGGCVEQDVLKKAWWQTRSGGASLVTYDNRSDDDLGWGLGVGCDGKVEVLLEPERPGGLDAIDFIARCCKTQARGALATVFGGPLPLGAHVAMTADGQVTADDLDGEGRATIAAECQRVLEGGRSKVALFDLAKGPVDVLYEVVRPPPTLFVVGAAHDAVPVVTIARTVGWETVVCDATSRFGTRERFVHADEILVGGAETIAQRVDARDRALVVVMSHDYERDRACLAALLRSRATYIGMLGPRRRTSRMLGELGFAEDDDRVHAPVGLALGAETPQEIALAIVAEAQSVLAGAGTGHLRGLEGAIHDQTRRASA